MHEHQRELEIEHVYTWPDSVGAYQLKYGSMESHFPANSV